jgi:hypothetical protein
MLAFDFKTYIFVFAAALVLHLLFDCFAATGFCFNRNRIDPVKLAATVLKTQGRSKSGEAVNDQNQKDKSFLHGNKFKPCFLYKLLTFVVKLLKDCLGRVKVYCAGLSGRYKVGVVLLVLIHESRLQSAKS